MKREHCQSLMSIAVSRRRALAASIAGLAASAEVFSRVGRAADPEQPISTSELQPAVERIERVSRTQPVRLKPISRSFDSVIVLSMATDPKGELLAVAGDDHAIRIMDVNTLQVQATLEGHTDLIQSLEFNHRGNLLVSTGNDGRLILWNRDNSFRRFQTMGVNSALACARFAPDDSEIAAVGFQNEVHLFGKAQRPGRPKVQCDCTDLRSLAYRGDGKLLAVAGRNGHVHLFDRTTDSLLDAYGLHSGRIHDVRFVAASNVIVSAGEDGTVVMFDTEARKNVGRFPVSGGKLFSVCVINNQFLAVAGSDNVIRILDVDQGEVVESIEDHRGSIAALACTGQLLFSGGYDATLRRFDLTGLLGGGERSAERPEPLDR